MSFLETESAEGPTQTVRLDMYQNRRCSLRNVELKDKPPDHQFSALIESQNQYDSIATVGEIRVYRRADFQSGSRVLKKVF